MKRVISGLGLAVILVTMVWAVWLVTQQGNDVDARRVQSLAARGRYGEAEQILREHLGRRPEDAQAWLFRAQIALERRDYLGGVIPEKAAKQALADLSRIARGAPRLLAEAALYRGKAWHALGRWDEAEAAWKEALAHDPEVPEASWMLLELYYLEGRRTEARQVAITQLEHEKDPVDRLQLLVELLRQDVQHPSASSLAKTLEPIALGDPGGVRAHVAYGLALVRSSEAERGLEVLESNCDRHPDSAEAWLGFLTGIDQSGRSDREELLIQTWERVPKLFRSDPSYAGMRGRLAQGAGDWGKAAEEYCAAWREAPEDLDLAYRLAQAVRMEKRESAGEWAKRVSQAREAGAEERELYERVNARKDLHLRGDVLLFQEIARNRERKFRFAEALAWHRRILDMESGNPVSAAALARLAGLPQSVTIEQPPP